MLILCHPERTGPQTYFSLGVVSRRICGCFSAEISQYNRAESIETCNRRCYELQVRYLRGFHFEECLLLLWA